MTQPGESDSQWPQAGAPIPQDERKLRRQRLESRVRSDLWKAVWEASQVMSHSEIREHVEATIGEIVSDEP